MSAASGFSLCGYVNIFTATGDLVKPNTVYNMTVPWDSVVLISIKHAM